MARWQEPAELAGALFAPSFVADERRMDSREIPLSHAGWNRANPQLSFQSFAMYIHEEAKRVFLKDKYHSELFFFMPLNGEGHIVQWTGKERDAAADWVQKHSREHYVYGVVHVCECWVRFADGPNDHTLRQIADGEMRVSELRPEDRKEALSVVAQSRDGYAHNWLDEIVRDKPKGTPRLGKCREFSGGFEGRFGNLFS